MSHMTTDVASLAAGVLGGGFMAEVHSRAVRAARGTLAAVTSSSASSTREAAARLGAGRPFTSPDELVADDGVDVVHVCTPNATHRELALAALRAGKHVVCEKPLATTPADALELAEEARAADVVATVPFVYRYHPMVREARARLASGELGAILSLQGSYTQDWLLDAAADNWRVDPALGGSSRAFADIGSHLVDLVEFVAATRITRLAALTRTVHPERAGEPVATEDLAGVLAVTEADVVVSLFVSQVAAGRKNRLAFEISGTRAAVAFDQESPEVLWLGRRTGSLELVRDPVQLGAEATRLSVVPAGHPMGYQDAFNAFVADTYAAIGGARPEGLPTFEDGARAALVTDAVVRSAAADGAWVEVGGAP